MSDHEHDFADADALEPLDPDVEAALATALVAASRPAAISAARHEAILAACLDDPLAPPTDAERAAAEELRLALEGGADTADARLARMLAHGAAPKSADLERALERALEKAPPRARANVVFVVFGAGAGVLALAAGLALLFGPVRRGAEAPSAPELAELARSRSLAPLFAGDSELGASARLDRIERVRARELRSNRYLAWGVR